MRKLKLIHYFMFIATFYCISPVAKATYQDSIILQFLIAQFNIIMDVVEKVGFALEGAKKQLQGHTVQNAIKQKTDVLGGVIASQTKTLGEQKYNLQFGQIDTIVKEGKTYSVGSVASSGCFNKTTSSHFDELIVDKERYSQLWDEAKLEFSDPEISQAQIRQKVGRSYESLMNARDRIGNPFSPPQDLTVEDASNLSKIGYYLVNNNGSFVADSNTSPARNSNRLDDKQKYDTVSGTVTSVVNDRISKSIASAFTSDLKVSQRQLGAVNSALANSEQRTTANNLKTPKGLAMEMLEYRYKDISMKLEALENIQNQEKLLTVIALDKLNQYRDQMLTGAHQ